MRNTNYKWFEIRDGVEVIVRGQWYIVEGNVEDGMVFVVDQDGGAKEISINEIDHVYGNFRKLFTESED